MTTKHTSPVEPDEYLIRKGGCFYRPKSQGYTSSPLEAGVYTLKQAIRETHPNGPDGPRDELSYHHRSEFPELEQITQHSRTLIAAAQASEAASELLRIAMDDSYHDVPVVEKLAEALEIAVGLELSRVEECDLEYRKALETLRDECAIFIQGMAA